MNHGYLLAHVQYMEELNVQSFYDIALAAAQKDGDGASQVSKEVCVSPFTP